MQIETTKSDRSDFMKQMLAVGEKFSAKPEPEPEEVNQTLRNNLKAMLEAGEKGSPQISHNEINYDKTSDDQKMELCTRNSGLFGLIKVIDGRVKFFPRNCNKCEKCLEANTIKLKERVAGFKNIAENGEKEGQWRRKIVNEGTEAESLKKRIKRNQDDTRFECASSDSGKSEVWTYVKDEPGKNMDEIYGEAADPDTIDFDDLYKRNRSTGKKLTIGSAFKSKLAAPKKEDTERLTVPEIIIKDVSQQNEAARIIEQTNYVQEAKDANHAIRLYTYQFKYILQELKAANIEIAAIKLNYFNVAKDEILEGWNENVKFWMSMNASMPKGVEANTDITAHLHFPIEYEPIVTQ